MGDCAHCKYAEWDYEDFYHPRTRLWFVCDCKIDEAQEGCEKFEEED